MIYLIRSYNRNKDDYVNELIENVNLVEIKGNIIIFYDSESKGKIIAIFCLENVFVKIANKKKEKG